MLQLQSGLLRHSRLLEEAYEFMNNATCKDCVFRGEIAERKQSACGMCGDLTQAVITSVAADFNKFCSNKVTREDVQEMRQDVERLKARKEHDRGLLFLIETYISNVSELIAELRAENVISGGNADDKEV